jgi:hypothetical protein
VCAQEFRHSGPSTLLREYALRAICVLSLILLCVGYMAFVWETPERIALRELPGVSAAKERWVHTRTGWEKPSSWIAKPPVYEPPIHPLALAGLQMFISLAALIAFPAKVKANEAADEFE